MQLTITLNADESPDTVARLKDALDVFFDLTDTVALRVPHTVFGSQIATDTAAAIAADNATQSTATATIPDPATVGFGAAAPSPAVGTTPPGFDASQVNVDADGLPYDARINSKPPTKNQDGRWRKKKGVQESLVASVTAELRSLMALPAPGDVHAGSAIPSHETTAPPPPPAPTPAPPAADTTPPPPPPPPAATGVVTFPQLVAWVGPRIPKLGGPTVIAETLKGMGIVDGEGKGQLSLLAARPDLVPQVYDALRMMTGE